MIDVTPIINALIAIVAAIATAFAVPYFRSRTTADQREKLAFWVRIAVQAAEQLMGEGTGPAKKAYVLQFIEQRGYTADLDAIEVMIESEVLKLQGLK